MTRRPRGEHGAETWFGDPFSQVNELVVDGRVARANRAHNPSGYDEWWGQGRAAALRGKPREQPFTFAYSYEAYCWLDGYDDLVADRSK